MFEKAILELHKQYDKKSEGERRKQMAKDDLKRLFYRNKRTVISISMWIR